MGVLEISSSSPFNSAKTQFLSRLSSPERHLFLSTTSGAELVASIAALDLGSKDSSSLRLGVARLAPAVASIEKYGLALEVLQNAEPSWLASLWGGLRVCLHVASSFHEFFAKLTGLVVVLSDNLARLELYARLYPGRQALHKALAGTYEQVFEFFWGARNVFEGAEKKGRWLRSQGGEAERLQGLRQAVKMLWRPFKSQFSGCLDEVRRYIELVDREASPGELAEADREREVARKERERTVLRWKQAEERGKISREEGMGDEEMEKEEGRLKVIDWLSDGTGDPSRSHVAALKMRAHGTGKWLIESEEYRQWLQADQGILWLHGKAGSGKTVLTSTVIENLTTASQPAMSAPDAMNLGESAVAFFYCSHNDSSLQGAKNILRSILIQLCYQNMAFFSEVHAAYKRLSQQDITVPEAISIIRAGSRHFTSITVVVDALDECRDTEEVIDALIRIARGATQNQSEGETGNVNLFLTSRRESRIQRMLEGSVTLSVPMNKAGIHNDIDLFVSQQLLHLVRKRKLKLRDPSLQESARIALLKGSNGSFQWASSQLSLLTIHRTDRAIRTALADLPKSLDETYIYMLNTIASSTAPDVELAKRILRWLVHGRALLWPMELAELVAIESTDTSLDRSAVATDPNDILSVCSSLIRTVPDKTGVERVQLAHYSIHEFLVSQRIREAPPAVAQFYMGAEESHEILAKVCVRYLGFEDFGRRCKDAQELGLRLSTYHALGYAAGHWWEHFAGCRWDGPGAIPMDHVVPALQWFLDGKSEKYVSWLQCFYKTTTPITNSRDSDPSSPSPPSTSRGLPSSQAVAVTDQYPAPIYLATKLSLHPLVSHLLSLGSSPNYRTPSSRGLCLLHVSASLNDIRMIKLLVTAGADLEARAWDRELTPLHYAAEAANTEAVRTLLDCGAEVDSRSHSRSTPLYRAVRGGGLETVRVLLERGAGVSESTWDGFTPAHEAVTLGDPEILELLVSYGADITSASPGIGRFSSCSSTISPSSAGQNTIISPLPVHGHICVPGSYPHTSTSPSSGPAPLAIGPSEGWETREHRRRNRPMEFTCPHPGCGKSFPSKSEKAQHDRQFHPRTPPPLSSTSTPAPIVPTPAETPTSDPVPPEEVEPQQELASLQIPHNRPATQYFWCSAASCSELFSTLESRDLHESSAHAGLTVTFRLPNPNNTPVGTNGNGGGSVTAANSPTPGGGVVVDRLGSISLGGGMGGMGHPPTAYAGEGFPCLVIGCGQKFSSLAGEMLHEVNAHQSVLESDMMIDRARAEDGGPVKITVGTGALECREDECRKRFHLATSRLWHEMLVHGPGHSGEEGVKGEKIGMLGPVWGGEEWVVHKAQYGVDREWTVGWDQWCDRRDEGPTVLAVAKGI